MDIRQANELLAIDDRAARIEHIINKMTLRAETGLQWARICKLEQELVKLRREKAALYLSVTAEHTDLRQKIGQALNDEILRGAPEPDWNDSREIDRLVDAVLSVLNV